VIVVDAREYGTDTASLSPGCDASLGSPGSIGKRVKPAKQFDAWRRAERKVAPPVAKTGQCLQRRFSDQAERVDHRPATIRRSRGVAALKVAVQQGVGLMCRVHRRSRRRLEHCDHREAQTCSMGCPRAWWRTASRSRPSSAPPAVARWPDVPPGHRRSPSPSPGQPARPMTAYSAVAEALRGVGRLARGDAQRGDRPNWRGLRSPSPVRRR